MFNKFESLGFQSGIVKVQKTFYGVSPVYSSRPRFKKGLFAAHEMEHKIRRFVCTFDFLQRRVDFLDTT